MSELTFAIPFYKDVELLRHTLDSVRAQSSPKWRCLVVDDRGPDTEAARSLVESYQDERMSFYQNESNLGLAGNWNQCLEKAETDLVCLLHADDELQTDYLESMLHLVQENPESSLYFTQAKIIDGQGKPTFSFVDFVKVFFRPKGEELKRLHGEEATRRLLRGNFIMCPTITYSRARLGSERFNARWKMVLDLEFYLRLLVKGHTLSGTPRAHYRYRRHESNQTVLLTENLSRFEEECALLDEYVAVCESKGWPHAAGIAKRKGVVFFNILFNVMKDLLAFRLSGVSRKVAFLRRHF